MAGTAGFLAQCGAIAGLDVLPTSSSMDCRRRCKLAS